MNSKLANSKPASTDKKAALSDERSPLQLVEWGLEYFSNVRRYSMACPAMPTCGLAVAESERIAPGVLTDLEKKFSELGLDDAQLTIRMTGCPNGCSRPYTADIAFVGRRPRVYHSFVGGRLAGDRMADLYAGDVKAEDAIDALTPLLTKYSQHRSNGEGLGDFYRRGRSAPARDGQRRFDDRVCRAKVGSAGRLSVRRL